MGIKTSGIPTSLELGAVAIEGNCLGYICYPWGTNVGWDKRTECAPSPSFFFGFKCNWLIQCPKKKTKTGNVFFCAKKKNCPFV